MIEWEENLNLIKSTDDEQQRTSMEDLWFFKNRYENLINSQNYGNLVMTLRPPDWLVDQTADEHMSKNLQNLQECDLEIVLKW